VLVALHTVCNIGVAVITGNGLTVTVALPDIAAEQLVVVFVASTV